MRARQRLRDMAAGAIFCDDLLANDLQLH